MVVTAGLIRSCHAGSELEASWKRKRKQEGFVGAYPRGSIDAAARKIEYAGFLPRIATITSL